MKNAKHLLTLFFAVSFFSLKIVGLHLLTHHTDDMDAAPCGFCDIMATVSFTSLLPPDSDLAVAKNILFIVPRQKRAAAQVVFYKKPLESQSFARPPPFI